MRIPAVDRLRRRGGRFALVPALVCVLAISVFGAAAVFASTAGAAGTCTASTDNFTGASGGDWDTAGNWSAGVPSLSTAVCWPGTVTVDVGDQDGSGNPAAVAGSIQAAGSLQVDGDLMIGNSADSTLGNLSIIDDGSSTAGDVGLSGQLTLTGNFTQSAGEIVGPGSLIVDGNFDMTSGSGWSSQLGSSLDPLTVTQNGVGTFTIGGAGAQGETLYGSTLTTNTTDAAAGAVAVYDTLGGNGPASSIASSQPITLGEPAPATGGSYTGGGAAVTVTAPGFVTSGNTDMGTEPLVVDGSGKSSIVGTLTVNDGLTIGTGDELTTGSGSGDGIDANGTAMIAGTIDGSGVFSVDGNGGDGTVTVTGALTAPTIDVAGGLLNDELPAISTTTLNVTGGTLGIGTANDDPSDQITVTGNYTQSLGTLEGPGPLTVDGNFDLTSVNGTGEPQLGSFTDPIAVTQDGSGTFTIGGADPEGEVIDDSTVTTNTTDPASGAVSIDGSLTGNGESTITSTNEPIDFSQTGLEAGAYNFVAPRFVLGASVMTATVGNLEQTGPGATLVPAADTLNTAGPVGGSVGTVSIEAGTLTVDGSLNAEVELTDGGTLDGTGIVDGNGYGQSTAVVNTSGVVSPGDGATGTLDLAGSYSQGPGGTLQIQEDGTNNVSSLSVNGSLTLAGTLAMEPSVAYAGSAIPGDAAEFMTYLNGESSGAFSQVTSSPPLQDGETYSVQAPGGDVFANLYAVVGVALPPANTKAPTVTGTPLQGDQVSVSSNGTWTNNPTGYTYQWEDCTTAAATSCTDIGGATSSTYKLTSTDVGKYVTVVVTATDVADTPVSAQASNIVGPVSAPVVQQAPPPVAGTAPGDTTPPSVSGTPLPNDTLTCNPGTWTGSPTFTYSWQLNGTGIAGQTGQTLVVTILDEGGSITCSVTGLNAYGTFTANSGVSIVAAAGTLTCPKPSGSVTPTKVGPLRLGETKAAAHRSLPRHAVIGYGFDNFCLYGGWGIRGAYIKNKFAILLTANPFYSVDSVTPGETVGFARTKMKLGKLIVIGKSDWYIVKGSGQSNYVLYVEAGLVRGVGIAYKADTSTYAEQKKFLHVFYGT